MAQETPLNILVLNWQDITNPLAGGAEVHLHEVFERIAARGHRVTLFCHHFPGAAREEMRNGIRIFRHGGRFLFNFHVPLWYWKRFRKENYDVVVDDVNKIPFFTPLFVREPVQGVTHHLFGKSIFLETVYPLALYVYLMERLIKPVYRKVHFIIGSPSTHREYLDWGFPAEQVTVVNYCVNTSVYYPEPTNSYDPWRIGYFGRLKKYKSVDQLLRAMKTLEHAYPELRLDIIGDGDDKPRLEALTAELGLNNRVTFHGFIAEEAKAPLLQRMRFVVNTSSKEGWGLTVVEANACGIPVVAANVPGLQDSVVDGRTGLLYEYGNIDDMIAKMKQFLDSSEVRNEFRERALAWAAEFDWERAADQTLELMRTRTIDTHRSASR
ncbi:MAG TPA: glycosyltransferase family 4 protein [Bacteroidota bacterium]|nr:glycosyltransferase family 4 protein [Bacteroidota bacterium]